MSSFKEIDVVTAKVDSLDHSSLWMGQINREFQFCKFDELMFYRNDGYIIPKREWIDFAKDGIHAEVQIGNTGIMMALGCGSG